MMINKMMKLRYKIFFFVSHFKKSILKKSFKKKRKYQLIYAQTQVKEEF